MIPFYLVSFCYTITCSILYFCTKCIHKCQLLPIDIYLNLVVAIITPLSCSWHTLQLTSTSSTITPAPSLVQRSQTLYRTTTLGIGLGTWPYQICSCGEMPPHNQEEYHFSLLLYFYDRTIIYYITHIITNPLLSRQAL